MGSHLLAGKNPAYGQQKERDLETGDTGDSLWDSAQMGLVRHGVMHNNVRMTWGKGVARWIQDPNSAMNITQCLNDRYALDGRDPNSIAGVMWCYGLFDSHSILRQTTWEDQAT